MLRKPRYGALSALTKGIGEAFVHSIDISVSIFFESVMQADAKRGGDV
jgi:hypothetical protein